MEIKLEVKHRGLFRFIGTILHFVGTVHFNVAVYHRFDFINKTAETYFDRFGWALKYVITWEALFQAWYFSYALIVDIIKYASHLNEPPHWMTVSLALVKSCFAFPSAIAFAIPFWIMYLFRPEYVYMAGDKAKRTPLWLLHMLTTNALLFMIIDTLVTKCDYPSFSVSSAVVFGLFSAYVCWLFIIKVATGIWLYPIIDRLSFPQKILVFFAVYVISLSCHVCCRLFNNIFWSESFYSRNVKEPSYSERDSEEAQLKTIMSETNTKSPGWFESALRIIP